MAEYRTWDDCLLMCKAIDKFVHILLRVEAQAMHTCIEFDVCRPTGDTLLACCLDECIEQSEAVYLGLKIIVEHSLKRSHLWVHYHNVGSDASLTQRYTLIGHSHSQIVHTMILQRLCYFDSSCTIGIGLDHTNHLGFGLHKRAIVVQILYHSVQVYLKDSLVHLLLQLLCYQVEPEWTCTLKQYQFVAQCSKSLAAQEVIHIGKELLVGYLYLVGLCCQLRTDTYKLGYAALCGQIAHLCVEFAGRYSCLEYITEDQCTVLALTTTHKVERYVERVDIRIIRVVYQYASTLSFLHLQSHGYRLQFWHAVGQFARSQSQLQCYCCTGDRVLYRSLIDKRNLECILLFLPYICNSG